MLDIGAQIGSTQLAHQFKARNAPESCGHSSLNGRGRWLQSPDGTAVHICRPCCAGGDRRQDAVAGAGAGCALSQTLADRPGNSDCHICQSRNTRDARRLGSDACQRPDAALGSKAFVFCNGHLHADFRPARPSGRRPPTANRQPPTANRPSLRVRNHRRVVVSGRNRR